MEENLTGAEWYDQTWREIKAANPDWEDQQVYDEMTRRMGEADWNARYQNVMADIANSSTPAEREQKINYYQAELASFKASGIDVDNDIEYLRVKQGAATVSVTEKIGSIFNDLYDGAKSSLASVVAQITNHENGPINTDENNIGSEAVQGITTNSIEAQYTIAPDDPAFLDARLSLEDIRNGYRLQYNPNGILWRVNSANMPHPDDLRNFYRQQEYNQAQLEQETEAGIRGLSQIKELLVQGASKADNALFEFNIGGYGFRIVDDSAGQKALLSAKVQEWARGMEFLGTGYSAGGLTKIGDAAGLTKAAEGLSKAVYEINKLGNTGNFRTGALEHILEGELTAKGKAVGFHFEGMPTAIGKVIPETVSKPNKFGVYTADVEIGGVPKSGNAGASSFFPKEWTPQQVVNSINEAYANRSLIRGNTFRGVIESGMEIEMYLDKTGQIISAFPIY